MGKLNNSFLWGIIFASATWSVSLYLYWLLNLSDETMQKGTESQIHYRYINREEKDRIKNNDKSIASLEGKNLLFDNPESTNHEKFSGNVWKFQKNSEGKNLIFDKPQSTNHEKFSGNVWQFQRSKDEYQRKMMLKEKFVKNLGLKMAKTDSSLVENQYGIIRNKADVELRNKGYNQHAFNTLVSQRIGNNRDLPDTRHALCKDQKFPKKLPKASIIICFYNEDLPTLTRSIYSILDRTDGEHLQEIILINDYSDIEELHENVEKAIQEINVQRRQEAEMIETNNIDVENIVDYINDDNIVHKDTEKKAKSDFEIKLLKTSRREGLIRARLYGAENSVGDVLVFLDSHIEVNVNWLPPLLARLASDASGKEFSTKAVFPIIDVINADTFEYSASPLVRGGFNWGLHFKWDNLPKGTLENDEDFVKPIKSPTMAGGLFAIYRKYFDYIGKYDPGMDVWGGENLELSFRLWMCGGTLEMIPCSRVGHVFRKRRPYGFGEKEDYMLKNSMRMARVWMDEYVDKVIQQNPIAAQVSVGDISERQALRKRLHCKSFQWYLDTVYPEMKSGEDTIASRRVAALNDPEKNKFQPWHSRKRNYTDSFQIRLKNTSLCIQSVKDIKSRGSGLMLASCIRTLNQMWFQTSRDELVLGRTLCLDAVNTVAPSIGKCHELGGSQEWKHKSAAASPIYNTAVGMCLGVEGAFRNEPIIMVICDDQPTNQWDLVRT